MTIGHAPLSCQRKLSILASPAHSGCVWGALILLSGVIYEGCTADTATCLQHLLAFRAKVAAGERDGREREMAERPDYTGPGA